MGRQEGLALGSNGMNERHPRSLGLYRILSGSMELHPGFRTDGGLGSDLARVQGLLAEALLRMLPPAPARVLDVGCGLGAASDILDSKGYEVTAIAPSEEVVAAARHRHPGLNCVIAGLFDGHSTPCAPGGYDVIIFWEGLRDLPDLGAVFQRARMLLHPKGRMVIGDEVAYDPETKKAFAICEASEIERAIGEAGFYVRAHSRMGQEVSNICRILLGSHSAGHPELIEPPGGPGTDDFLNMDGLKRWLERFSSGGLGYEMWDIRPDEYVVRTYLPGDEKYVLAMFQEVFGVSRTARHWKWKFLEDPFGGPYLTTVWGKGLLACNYSAYPVPVWMGDRLELTHQVGDTMTRPGYRGVGRGPTSLLARAVRLYHRLYCEGKVPFFYGFNTGKIQRFGRLFLRYEPVAPVYEWVLGGRGLESLGNKAGWLVRLAGYCVEKVCDVDKWADELFGRVRGHYGWLIARNAKYLGWRYLEHPDFDYDIILVRRFGRPVGFWVGRMEEDRLVAGDALFDPSAKAAPSVGLSYWLRMLRDRGERVVEVRGWFSEHPRWWTDRLRAVGFRRERQFQELDLCVTLFSERFTAKDFRERFYYTKGDSDLF